MDRAELAVRQRTGWTVERTASDFARLYRSAGRHGGHRRRPCGWRHNSRAAHQGWPEGQTRRDHRGAVRVSPEGRRCPHRRSHPRKGQAAARGHADRLARHRDRDARGGHQDGHRAEQAQGPRAEAYGQAARPEGTRDKPRSEVAGEPADDARPAEADACRRSGDEPDRPQQRAGGPRQRAQQPGGSAGPLARGRRRGANLCPPGRGRFAPWHRQGRRHAPDARRGGSRRAASAPPRPRRQGRDHVPRQSDRLHGQGRAGARDGDAGEAQQSRSRRGELPFGRGRDRVRRPVQHTADAGSRGARHLPVTAPETSSRPTALRGPVLTYTGDPFRDGLERTMVHEPDAIVVLQEGRISHFGPADRIAGLLPPATEIRDYGKDALISAGFIDSHVHFPQTPVMAAYGTQLLDWLNRYTFAAELKFADKEYARDVARVFLQENLR